MLVRLKSPKDVAVKAADLTVSLSEGKRPFSLALSGGSTPRLFHEALRTRSLDWSQLVILFSDERAVPPDHESSNFRMAKETLLDHVPIPEAQIFRIEAETEGGVEAYNRQLEDIGPIDLVLLGMGDDGHTASLFPGKEPTESGWCVAAKGPPPIEDRVTFTYEALKNASGVIFLITGEKKAARLAEVLSGDGDLPTQKVLNSRSSNTWVLVDEAAASLLPGEKF